MLQSKVVKDIEIRNSETEFYTKRPENIEISGKQKKMIKKYINTSIIV